MRNAAASVAQAQNGFMGDRGSRGRVGNTIWACIKNAKTVHFLHWKWPRGAWRILVTANSFSLPRIILLLGAARSGKSAFAQITAERLRQRPLYIATAEALDGEMADRIAAHRASRGKQWLCVEEPLEIARVIERPPPEADIILVDCLTIWLSNILQKEGVDAFNRRRQELVDALRKSPLPVMLVSNEVGMGIVPDSELGRNFRDLAGWLNQSLAAVADTVLFIVAGLPMALKGSAPAMPPGS
jgi:adenosylcobinamide kinase / adenosylcobinamide-phosphate guanylyltransferase